MDSISSDFHVDIRIANKEDLFELNSSAQDLIELIRDFKINLKKDKYFILTAFHNNLLIGVLVAKKRIHKVDSLEMLVPKVRLYLIYVNKQYRNLNIGKKLLGEFVDLQKKRGSASIYVKLPQKYKQGIKFFMKNQFQRVDIVKSKIILEYHLWEDYGITNCEIIDDSMNNILD